MSRVPAAGFVRARYLAPLVYLGFAVLAWLGFARGFARSGADPLAGIGLVFMVLPVAIVDIIVNLLWLHGDVVQNWCAPLHRLGLPAGYLLDFAYYYVPRVLVMVICLHLVLRLAARTSFPDKN